MKTIATIVPACAHRPIPLVGKKENIPLGTPEEVEFSVKLSNGASEFDEDDCREAMERIINSCDGNDPNNPMNWKFGGEWQRGPYTYQINPQRERTLHKRSDGRCKSWWKLAASGYRIQGNGWAGWDHGQQTLLKAARNCNTGLTSWRFKYYEDPDDNDGCEWKAEFDTVVFTGNRCFNNLKVQKGAGGYTHKGKKNIDEEEYEGFGCSGGG